MNLLKGKFERRTIFIESIKNIAEIIAFTVGAIWALYNFKLKESPALLKSATASNSIQIDSVRDGKVHVIYYTTMKNIGKTAFEVESVKIQYWRIANQNIINHKYFSFHQYMGKNPITDSINDFSQATIYSPGVEYGQGFDFFFPSNSDTTILIRATYYCQGNEGFFSEKHSWTEDIYDFAIQCVASKKDKN
jgi:hypothetical protein